MTTRGAKRAATFEPAAPDLPSKRVMDGPSFDVHRAESSHQNVMAGPATLDPVRAEAASKHVKALNTQFASWVQLQLQNHPLEIWEDGLKDYMSHASEIMEKFKDVVDWLRKNKAGSKGVSSPGPLNDEKTNLQAEDSSKSVAQTSSDSGQKVPTTSSPFSVSQSPNSPSTFSFSSQQKPPSFTGTFGDKKSTPSDSSKSTFQFGGTNSIFGAKNSPGDSSKPALQFGATNSIFGDKNSPSDSSKPAFQFAANNSIFGDKKSPSDSSKPAFQFGARNSIFGDKNSPSNSIFGDKKSPSDSSKPAFQIGASNSIFGDKNSPSDSSKPAFSFGANNGISASTSNSPSIFSNSSAQSFSMQTPALFSVNQQSFPSDAEPEKPSSPSVKKAEEKGIVVVHEAKCKVYVKHDDASKGWKDIGVGQLSIRSKEGAEKASKESTPTIVIRNDVGKILLNALIYKGIKMNVQKNTVASIFHTSDAESSESDGGTVVARTYLFRLKNEEEATKLSTAIKENAPTD